MRILFTVILFLISTGCLTAQESKQYSFKHFSVTNGLASNTVSTVIQDKDGFIWIATVNGLQRYDGSGFITFKSKSSDPRTIPTNHIITIFEDKKKNLWLVGDNNKIGIFDTKKFIFKEVIIPPEQRKFYIPQNFIESPAGDFLLLKEDGNLLKYVEKENRFILAPDALPGPKNWKRRSIVWDSARKKYWMSCDSGFAVYDPVTRHMNYRGHNIDNDAFINEYSHLMLSSHIFLEKSGDLVFNHWPKGSGGPNLYRYSFKRKNGKGFHIGHPRYHEIAGWMQQRNGRLWIFGMPFLAEWIDMEGSNVIKFIPNEYKNEQSLKFDYAFNCFEDRENNIWIATDNGVFLFNPDAQVFSTYYMVQPNKPFFEAPVQAIEEMPDGKVFVGCWGGVISCYDLNFNPQPLPSAFPDGNISVW
ncbi:MAG: ligand-binding sensor domain-containing protein, partial [Flavisolibacter sp.]